MEPLARYFEYWLLRLQGVYPESREARSSARGALAFLAASRGVAPDRIGDVPAESSNAQGAGTARTADSSRCIWRRR